MSTRVKRKGAILESLREGMRTLATLVRMQLKEKLDLSYMSSLKQLILKCGWLVIEFAAITAIITVVFHYVKLLGLFSLVHDIPVSVISLIFTVMLALSVITDTVGLMKALYFSRDNSVLLTFPATPSLVFLSKLAVYYVYEIRKNFMFTIPMFIAYGIAKSYAPYYYPWLAFMFILISVLPVLLSALLSIPSMFVYIFLNRFKVVQYIVYAAAIGLGIVLLWAAIGMIPDDINFIETWGETYWQLQSFLKSFTEVLLPIYVFTQLIVGKTVGINNIIFHSQTFIGVLVLLLIAAALLLLCFVCSKPLFFKMASTPFEFKKKNAVKAKSNKKSSPFASALKKEWKGGIRSGSFMRLSAILIVAMPMAIALLNKIYSAMNTRFLGTQMTVCFNVLIILLIILMTNIDIASVYSRDGSSSYLNKIQPAPYSTLLFSKLFFPMLITLIGVSFTVTVFASLSELSSFDAVMLGISVYCVYLMSLFSSAESDIMNPQYEQYATFNNQANNPNETMSGISAIITSFIFFIVALFLSSGSSSGVWIKLAAIAAAMAGFRVFTYLMKIKAFYKEKE